MTTITIEPMHPLFVGDVEGVTLSRDMDEATVHAVDEAINKFAVLIFHEQKLDNEELYAVGQRFGRIAAPRNHRAGQRIEKAGIADISNLDDKGEVRRRNDNRRLDGLGNQLWHSDASFRPISGALSMLYAEAIPPKGGDTEFADLRAAYDELDSEMKDEIEGLMAEHTIFHSRGLLGHTDYSEEERKALPAVRHPLVRAHPGSQRKTLYLGAHASHIIDWPIPEGRLLLHDLTAHATDRRFTYAHQWAVGDLVIWDNRCTLHRGRRYDDVKHKRDLRRVTTQDLDSINDNPELVVEMGLSA